MDGFGGLISGRHAGRQERHFDPRGGARGMMGAQQIVGGLRDGVCRLVYSHLNVVQDVFRQNS